MTIRNLKLIAARFTFHNPYVAPARVPTAERGRYRRRWRRSRIELQRLERAAAEAK